MEFIKKMKKREFIEMGLKALAALLAAFIAIILMEGMIYGIHLKSLEKNYVLTNDKPTTITNGSTSKVYAIERGDNKYLAIIYDEEQANVWSAYAQYLTKEDLQNKLTNKSIASLEFEAPSAFELTITPVHYGVMAGFVAIIAGFFVYKFVKLSKQYKKIEEDFLKTGTIEISNV